MFELRFSGSNTCSCTPGRSVFERGLIGLSGKSIPVDGDSVPVPTFRIQNAEGKWVVGNDGIHPPGMIQPCLVGGLNDKGSTILRSYSM